MEGVRGVASDERYIGKSGAGPMALQALGKSALPGRVYEKAGTEYRHRGLYQAGADGGHDEY